jgi:hypothetical protein
MTPRTLGFARLLGRSARQALEIAMRCEQKAHGELRDEEVHYQELVHRELLRLPAGADTGGEDFVDEPNAQ